MIYSRFTSLAVALLLAVEVTVAQPHGKRHHKRSPKAVAEPTAETQTEYETVYVYVDENGNRVENYSPEASAPAPEQHSVDVSSLNTANTANKGVASISGSKPGIVYSPYNDDGSCKSSAQVSSDFASLQDYPLIRIYGVDCNQVPNVLAAKGSSTKLFVGIFNVLDSTQFNSDMSSLIKSASSAWGSIHTVAIGNELVNSGASASAVVTVVNSARTTLRAAGYTGPVVTVDTFVAIMNNPVLCQNSDYIAANCHPYYDGKVDASGAGSFLTTQSANIKAACPGKDLLYTETGWPHQGEPNGLAKASVSDQTTALKSIWAAMGSNVILFTFRDDLWKQNTAATFNAEKYWGIKDYSIFN
ncbi:uncharacterized protein H6S33_013022 [Morchella sextelata]|uniref:uncharacterized protein n=1 Tax=Morchella sextelata TaxID=1174677 RepID=UPI001D037F2D|nr:uncharacterized protein H6S33_013022 [Morchella sextelata]KAH0609536.1 hypothetical protein H6S33_013022 [Morchella sextelata]